METNEYKERMITYLYGEMTLEEKKEFERILGENPELKKDLEELKQMREGLRGLEDKEIMEPYYMWRNRSGWALNRLINPRFTGLRYVTAIAASVLIIILAGYILKINISFQDKTLAISFFNGQGTYAGNMLTQNDVIQLVKDEIARNNDVILSKLENTEEKIDTKIASLESASSVQMDNSSLVREDREELERLLTRLNDQNLKALESYVSLTNAQQQQNFQDMLNSLSEYITYQRTEDLRLINRGFQTLRETQEQQKRETDQILANIISNVRYQNN